VPSAGRPNALLGNNRLTIVLDEGANLLHIYYPHVGMWQHMNQFRTGVFFKNRFSWFPPYSQGIEYEQKYLNETLEVETRFEYDGIELKFLDLVHPQRDVFIRKIFLRGESVGPLKLYFYNRLNIAETYFGETVFYDHETNSVIHFKNGYFFLFGSDPAFSACACGEHTVKGLHGTFVDAEDGNLVSSDVSHGSVDSTVELVLPVRPHWNEFHYFMAAGRSLDDVNATREYLVSKGLDKAMAEAGAYWFSWIRHKPKVDSNLSDWIRAVHSRSLYILENCVDADGAVIASPDSGSAKFSGDSYNYCWWRDAAYVSMALNEVGMSQLTLKFLKFASRNQTKEGYFYHRQRPDGSWGSTWHRKPFIQLDQTSSVICAVHNYYKYTNDVASVLEFWPMVKSAAQFLVGSVTDEGLPRPSYDLWEERFGVHIYTATCVWQGLLAAELVSDVLGKERRGWSQVAESVKKRILSELGDGIPPRMLDQEDRRADSSMLMLINTGLLPASSSLAKKLVSHVETRLGKANGGLARYEGDTYWGYENPWVISTLWLAQAKMILGNYDAAYRHIEWVASTATKTGLLPEQVEANTGKHLSVIPLTWSHATFVSTANMYSTRNGVGGYLLAQS
jgi:GH15 family glucan-1,4-alpha-glucosidase